MFHLFCHRQGSGSFLTNTCSGLTLQRRSSSADVHHPARCLSSCRSLLNPSRQHKWLCLWWSPQGSRSLPTKDFRGRRNSNEQWYQAQLAGLRIPAVRGVTTGTWTDTTATTPAVETRQHGLIDYAGAHLCGQAGSRHVSHLNFTGMEQDPISLLQKGSPGALFLEQLRLMGPGRYRRRHICRGPGDALALRSSTLLARSLPVKWLTLKINSVISNKLFFLFLPLSISSGDRFLLVAISFHNTAE